jgi:integrase
MANIRQRGGRWQVQIRRKGQKPRTETFGSYELAKAFANGEEHRRDQGRAGVREVSTQTFGKLIDDYETRMWKVRKWGDEKTRALRLLKTDLGDTRLCDINSQTVVEYALQLAQRMQPPGVLTRLSYLHVVIETGRDLFGLEVPLAEIDDGIRAARRQKLAGKGRARTRNPTADEIDQVVAAHAKTDSGTDLAAIVEVLRVLPIRVGELLKINWTDLRPKQRAVMLRARKLPDGAQKQHNDDLVPLPVIDGIDTYDLIAGRNANLSRPFPFERQTVSATWWEAARASGVEDLHLHDLRAHGISNMLWKGVPIPVVAMITGHKNWSILQKVYERITPDQAHAAIEMGMKRAFGEQPPARPLRAVR